MMQFSIGCVNCETKYPSIWTAAKKKTQWKYPRVTSKPSIVGWKNFVKSIKNPLKRCVPSYHL